MLSRDTKILVSLLAVMAIIFSCGDKMPLPSVQYSPESFGANDTSYIHLQPDWDEVTIGYEGVLPMMPVDIAIGIDDYIFVADSANNKVFALDKSGSIESNYNLDKIYPIEAPSGIDINEKLNLLIVNNTNKIYVWNQYLNFVGVDSVLLFSEEYPNGYLSDDVTIIDSLMGITLFYEDEDETSQFNSIAFGPKEDNLVYATDKANNRIVEISQQTTGVVILKNGYPHRIFSGDYVQNIAEEGSGAGTVDSPRSITCDADGSVYFTQLGGNFLVQKLNKQGSSFSPAFTLYEDEIMDLERFRGPYDIALDPDNDIFVIDAADSGRVSKFFNHGISSGDESDLGNEGLSLARFNQPRSIAISDDGVVYIANTYNHSIERYRYTISEDDLPDDKK